MTGQTHLGDATKLADYLAVAVDDLFLKVHADLASCFGVILYAPFVKECKRVTKLCVRV